MGGELTLVDFSNIYPNVIEHYEEVTKHENSFFP